MGISFHVGGYYAIEPEVFWRDIFFDEKYTEELYRLGLGFPGIEILDLEKKRDGCITRKLAVTPHLVLPKPIQKFVGDGLNYHEIGRFCPNEMTFDSILTIPRSPKLITIQASMRLTRQNDGSRRDVDFLVNSSVFGIARLVEKTAKVLVPNLYSQAEVFTNRWLKAQGL